MRNQDSGILCCRHCGVAVKFSKGCWRHWTPNALRCIGTNNTYAEASPSEVLAVYWEKAHE